jgi:hypothetical protein
LPQRKPREQPRWVEYVRLDEIQHAPRNPKGHAGEAIARSIDHHGMAEVPLRDDRTGRLVAGHGRHAQLVAMHAAGKGAPDGILVDDDGMWRMPIVTGWASRSDSDAEAYLVGSNQLTTAGGWDQTSLVEVLADLRDADLIDLTGFDDTDLSKLIDTVQETNRLPTAGDADTDDLTPSLFGLIVECDTEEQQVTLLEKLTEEGFTCRALL